MAESVHNNFPSQVVSDAEKLSYDYGLKIAKAIEGEWFGDYRTNNRHNNQNDDRYGSNKNNFHELRLYARGEQSVQKYKDELSINGDLSYLNLDWKPVPIISKFVDIVVNGISERTYDIKAYAQDPYSVAERSMYMQSIMRDMETTEFNDFVSEAFGLDTYENNKGDLPESKEELAIHMQLTYKQSIEIAEEQALNVVLENNRYELIRKRFFHDLTVLGIGAVKTGFNNSDGITIDYVDPAHLVYSHTDSPYFEDVYYVGEIKEIPINELAKEFPHLTHEDLEEIVKSPNQNRNKVNTDKNKVQVLYFDYKTYMNEVYKVKEVSSGASKAITKDDTFNPPEEKEGTYNRMSRQIECLYEGAKIVGTDKLLRWEMSKNMMRPKSDHSVIGRSFTQDGDMNPGKVPIQEITSGSGGNKIQALIGNYNYYLQMIRDVTGLNEARDGSMPDKNALVGVQKLAAANSNTATRHILQSGLFLTSSVAECLSLRISDVLEYSPAKDSFAESIGAKNVGTLSDLAELHIHDFGIFIELTPDEEEKMLLENNIQQAIAQQSIDLEDAIDVREIKNIKLANQVLKIRRQKKQVKDQAIAERNMQAQAEANIKTQQASAQLEVQKEQAKSQSQAMLEQMKGQMDAQKMMQEAEIKKQMMQLQFQYDMQLKQLDMQVNQSKDTTKEDRKDKRTKIQASQQSQMIDQRSNDRPPKDFEQEGQGGLNIDQFKPTA